MKSVEQVSKCIRIVKKHWKIVTFCKKNLAKNIQRNLFVEDETISIKVASLNSQ
jgi:hypothetical protein